MWNSLSREPPLGKAPKVCVENDEGGGWHFEPLFVVPIEMALSTFVPGAWDVTADITPQVDEYPDFFPFFLGIGPETIPAPVRVPNRLTTRVTWQTFQPGTITQLVALDAGTAAATMYFRQPKAIAD
jgi:hypothetical protein